MESDPDILGLLELCKEMVPLNIKPNKFEDSNGSHFALLKSTGEAKIRKIPDEICQSEEKTIIYMRTMLENENKLQGS